MVCEPRADREKPGHWFLNVVSGKTFDRLGLAALLDYARKGDTLFVIRLDRLGRSLRELLQTVDTLKAREINLVSLEENIDTTSAAGELVFHVFGAIAHFERRLISERTKDGLLAARKRGRTPGRPSLHADTVSAIQELVAINRLQDHQRKQDVRVLVTLSVR